MIRDKTILQDVLDNWKFTRLSQQRFSVAVMSGFGMGGFPGLHTALNMAGNIALLYAYSVLDQVLRQLKEEGHFRPQRVGLKACMDASKPVLNWVNFVLVDEGRERRNRIAHEQEFLERIDCWKYINAIEAELIAWRILPGPIVV